LRSRNDPQVIGHPSRRVYGDPVRWFFYPDTRKRPEMLGEPLSADNTGAAAASAAAADQGRRNAATMRKRKFSDDLANLRNDVFDIVSRGVRIVLTIATGTAIYFFVDVTAKVVTSDFVRGWIR